jgi:type IV fimbrial biogenesis protein FimT
LNSSCRYGFTLIEALVTVALLAIILSLGVPSLQGMMVSSKVSFITNDFSAALAQTRALAIARNTCATLCAAADVDATISSTTATCNAAAAAHNFQAGWVIFENPSCDIAQRLPTANGNILTAARRGEGGGYAISPSDADLSLIMFDPRGLASLSSAGNFQVTPPSGIDGYNNYRRTICIDAAGRALVRLYTTTC